MHMLYGIYPVDTDVSDFLATAYQTELILRLVTKPEMGWYTRNMPELQPPNRTIGFTEPTHRLITHQVASWTQQLYKDKHTRTTAQARNHPNPSTPIAKITVTDTMKIYPFCDPMRHTPHRLLHGDSIHLHAHCSNTHLTRICDHSNTDIFTALYHLGILFTHSLYPHNLGRGPFQTFLCHLLHQYDDGPAGNGILTK